MDAPLEPGAQRLVRPPPTALAGATLELDGLEVYRGDYRVCADLSLRIEPGNLLHLRGANGAGKTSLIRVLTGFAFPEAGTVRFGREGLAPQSLRYRECLRYVGHRDGVKPELSPRENLRFATRLLVSGGDGEVDAALERVGLAALCDRRCAELSAGQRRRLALARLLPGESRLWLLDEPLTNLDAEGTHLVRELLGEHLGRGGIAVLATHQSLSFEGLAVVAVDLPAIRHHVS